jgi:predicted amidohydrolase
MRRPLTIAVVQPGCVPLDVAANTHRRAQYIRATGAYRKLWLGAAESRRFTPGAQPVAIEVDGWRLGLAICKDTSLGRHQRDTMALGIDAYVGGSGVWSPAGEVVAQAGSQPGPVAGATVR